MKATSKRINDGEHNKQHRGSRMEKKLSGEQDKREKDTS